MGFKKKKSRNYGHLEGVRTVKKIVEASILFKIPIISLYVFSSENWKRPKSEINYLFNLIKIYFKKEINNIVENKIKNPHCNILCIFYRKLEASEIRNKISI